MLKINKLYTIPCLIDPIEFSEGLNIILGEKDESSDKTNGVGKSLCIEFIDFALLKKKPHSRVSFIPEKIFPSDTLICLDFELNNEFYTIRRSINQDKQPIIVEGNREIRFDKIESATKYLTEKLFCYIENTYPNFRTILHPLIRDERCEFKSLAGCYDTKLRIAEDYTPHLYLLGINIYEAIKINFKNLEDISKNMTKIEENVQLIRQKKIKDARADINKLDDEVKKIENSINELENLNGYEIIKNDLISLEEKIDLHRRKKMIFQQQLTKLKPISQKIDIKADEISEFYTHLKERLGEIISQDLEQVINFKKKIDEFQNKLISDRKDFLSSKIIEIDEVLEDLDKKYSVNLSIINQQGGLKNLKQTYASYKEKSDQLSQLRSFVNRYNELELKKQKEKTEKEANLLKLQSDIQSQKDVITEFEKTILDIHEYIQGNRDASFVINQLNKKQVVEMDMRIDSDGGHSIEREKVFIYDIALLLNKYTQGRHPKFLIHDNIFDVDQDTLIKSIHYLNEKANLSNVQYILTLNSDRLELESKQFLEYLEPYVKERFTKSKRFLKKQYQEIRSR